MEKDDRLKLYIWSRQGESLLKINEDLKENFKEDYHILNYVEGDILFMHYIDPPAINWRFKKKVLIQPVDGTIINSGMTENINQFNYVITPSSINKQQLIDSGVEVPITVIPNYYDSDLLESDNGFFEQLFDEKKYTFYTESTGVERKNIENLLKHFLETFTKEDNTRLIIKLNQVENKIITKLKSIIDSYQNRPEVILLNKRLPEKYLNSLERGIDCYICLSHMEGFCVPLLNAAVLKKDIITLDTKISGYKDFINKDNALLIPTKEIEMPITEKSTWMYSVEAKWEDVDYQDYRKALKSVYNGEYKFNKSLTYDKYRKENVMKEYDNFITPLSGETREKIFKIKKLAEKRNKHHFSKFRMPKDLNDFDLD